MKKIGYYFFRLIASFLYFYHKYINHRYDDPSKSILRNLYIIPYAKTSFILRQKNLKEISNLQNNSNKTIIKNLIINGFSQFNELDNEKSAEVYKYFLDKEVYCAHLPVYSDKKKISAIKFLNSKMESAYSSFDTLDTFNSDIIFNEILKNKEIWDIAKSYLNSSKIKCYEVATMLTKKNGVSHPVTSYHRDNDCIHSLVLMYYWNETSAEDGATSVVNNSHLDPELLNVKKYEPPTEKITYLESKKGGSYFFDPFLFHAGNKKIKNNRLVTVVKFASFPTISSILDGNYEHKNKFDNINKLMN